MQGQQGLYLVARFGMRKVRKHEDNQTGEGQEHADQVNVSVSSACSPIVSSVVPSPEF